MLMVGLLRRFVRFFIHVLQQIRRVENRKHSVKYSQQFNLEIRSWRLFDAASELLGEPKEWCVV